MSLDPIQMNKTQEVKKLKRKHKLIWIYIPATPIKFNYIIVIIELLPYPRDLVVS